MSEKTSKYKDSCRFCLKYVEDFDKIQISDLVRMKFKNTVGIDLRFAEDYPEFHCVECSEELQTCYAIKEKFAENQRFLETEMGNSVFVKNEIFLQDSKDEYLVTEIKIEAESNPLIECSFEIPKIIETPTIEQPENLIQTVLKTVKQSTVLKTTKLQKFKCGIDRCDKSFYDLSILTTHRQISHPKSKFCSTCNLVFKFPCDLNVHLKRYHPDSFASKQLLECPDCGKLMTKRSLEKHKYRAHPKSSKLRDHICDKCGVAFSKRHILNHIMSHLVDKFSCECCGEVFSTKSKYDAHMTAKHKNTTEEKDKTRIFQCPIEGCEKKYNSKALLNWHTKLGHKANSVECPICHKTIFNLKRHIKIHDDKVNGIPCNFNDNGKICQMKFLSRMELRRHLQQKHPKIHREAPCPDCGKMYRTGVMKNHRDRVHRKVVRYICDVCGYKFFSKARVTEHLKIHFGIKEFECELCGWKYVSNYGLTQHKKLVHEKIIVKTCEYCGKTFNNSSLYTGHISSKHTGERNYPCDIENCGKWFFSNSLLAAHKKKGHKTAEQCPICNISVKNVKRHMAMHEEKPFVCDFVESNGEICGKKYAFSLQLKNHVDLIHRGIKKYNCKICNTFYTNGLGLANHNRNIHEKRKIKCELCSALLGEKGYYVKHIRAHHKELSNEAKKAILQKIKDTKTDDLFNHRKE